MLVKKKHFHSPEPIKRASQPLHSLDLMIRTKCIVSSPPLLFATISKERIAKLNAHEKDELVSKLFENAHQEMPIWRTHKLVAVLEELSLRKELRDILHAYWCYHEYVLRCKTEGLEKFLKDLLNDKISMFSVPEEGKSAIQDCLSSAKDVALLRRQLLKLIDESFLPYFTSVPRKFLFYTEKKR